MFRVCGIFALLLLALLIFVPDAQANGRAQLQFNFNSGYSVGGAAFVPLHAPACNVPAFAPAFAPAYAYPSSAVFFNSQFRQRNFGHTPAQFFAPSSSVIFRQRGIFNPPRQNNFNFRFRLR